MDWSPRGLWARDPYENVLVRLASSRGLCFIGLLSGLFELASSTQDCGQRESSSFGHCTVTTNGDGRANGRKRVGAHLVPSCLQCVRARGGAKCAGVDTSRATITNRIKMGKKTRRQREKHVSVMRNGVRHTIPADKVDEQFGWRLNNGKMLSRANLKSEMGTIKEGEKKLLEMYGEDEGDFLSEYMAKVVYEPYIKEANLEEALRRLRRWPRIRKYWPRMRRRVCWYCGKRAELSEPRYLVCGGCVMDGEDPQRYCSEECQRKGWPEHQKKCPAGGRVPRKRVPADVVD